MMVRCLLPTLAACLAVGFSPGGQVGGATSDCSRITLENTDECVRLNEIQLLGTHNSYHIAPAPPMLAALGSRARDIEYTHRPLVEQLSQLGIRKFELDVFADPEGGRFATPAAFRMVKGLEESVPSSASAASRCSIRRTSTTARRARR